MSCIRGTPASRAHFEELTPRWSAGADGQITCLCMEPPLLDPCDEVTSECHVKVFKISNVNRVSANQCPRLRGSPIIATNNKASPFLCKRHTLWLLANPRSWPSLGSSLLPTLFPACTHSFAVKISVKRENFPFLFPFSIFLFSLFFF